MGQPRLARRRPLYRRRRLDTSPAAEAERRQIALEVLAETYAVLLGVGPAWLTTELLLRLSDERKGV